jgi:uncharacterized membrane-anchored protein
MKHDSNTAKALSFRVTTACLVAGLLSFTPTYLSAQEPADQQRESQASKEKRYEEHLSTGTKAYKNKDFGKALEELQAAYDIDPRASILFNMGIISEKNGDLEGASDYYRKFIGARDVGLAARKRASERLAVVNEILDQRNKSKSNSEMTNLMPALEAMNADLEGMGQGESAETQPADGQQQANQNQAANKKTTAKNSNPIGAQNDVDYGWEPYAAFTVGTGALVGGVVALTLFNNSVDEAKKTPEGTTMHLQHERDASDYLTLSSGMFITGGAVIALGTYFIVARQAEQYSSVEADDTSTTSVSVGADYVGLKYSLDF